MNMKLRNYQQFYSPKREMNLVKEALKKDYLYDSEELRKLKSRLTELRQERAEPNQTGLGFVD